MSKLYDNYFSFVKNFHQFFSSFSNKKTFLNFLPNFLFGLINSESITLSEIALSIVPLHNDILLSSIERRCSRFLNNPNFSIHNILILLLLMFYLVLNLLILILIVSLFLLTICLLKKNILF